MQTFYWHDYETFGKSAAYSRPSQFAGIRTDTDLNIIGEPLMIYCQPAKDFLPEPEACLITGITPQQARSEGIVEAEFIARIHQELSQANTCTVGYNSIRFDDEFTRHCLYRNFYDPYAREWQNGNSRWDLIDLVRTCRAFRPEGIEWPEREDGLPSYKLEHMSQANGLAHDAAHDALSDVIATIELAKLIKEKQPKLFTYALEMRSKQKVQSLLNVATGEPVLHVSSMFGSERFCTALLMPLAIHPVNKNEIICYDLSVPPDNLLTMDADSLRDLLYVKQQELAQGQQRLALKSIHINRSPMVFTAKLLDDRIAEQSKINVAQAREHYKQIKADSLLTQKIREIYAQQSPRQISDPDGMLYSGGFFSHNDRNTMNQIIASTPEQLATNSFAFEDARLSEMLFRFRGRNFPHTLNSEELMQWQEYCYQRITESENTDILTMEVFQEQIEYLLENRGDEKSQAILNALLDYSDELLMA